MTRLVASATALMGYMRRCAGQRLTADGGSVALFTATVEHRSNTPWGLLIPYRDREGVRRFRLEVARGKAVNADPRRDGDGR